MAEHIITEEAQRIAGALDCLKHIRHIENVAEHMPEEANDAAVYYDLQAKAGFYLAEAFGPMTPRQEGAFRALGEYIHLVLEAGTPCLDVGHWKPTVALTQAELQTVVKELAAAE